MATIGVIGGCEVISAMRLLEDIYAGCDKKANILSFDQNSDSGCQMPDIIIITGDKELDEKLRGIDFSETKILIVNADLKNIFNRIYSLNIKLNCNMKGKIITYGFNPKSCVTASSVAGDDCKTIQYCIQRSLPTFAGEPVDEQEFSVSISDGHPHTDAVLAAVTAALVDGIGVDRCFHLSKASFDK